MFINNDIVDFFKSMVDIKKQKRDVFNALAADVDDPTVKETLLSISTHEQQHVDKLQKSMELINGGPYHPVETHASTAPFSPANHPIEQEQQKISHAVIEHDAKPSHNEEKLPDYSSPSISSATIPHKNVTKKPLAAETQQSIGLVKHVQQHDSNRNFQPTASQNSYSMNTFKHPLAEVFGFTATDHSSKAQRYRSHRHCPFNNKVPNCTKDQTKNPLGVCSLLHENRPVITCPVRFREDWLITDDAASFFFEDGVRWSSLTEVRLTDAYGKSAGDIDVVLVAYDEHGKIVDFGAIEIQAALISGDPRDPFDYYMRDPKANALMDWTAQSNYPQPDFVSSIREKLVPQLIFKGCILNSWHKKIALTINRSYFEALPDLITVTKEEAEMAWFIYDLELVADGDKEHYQLQKVDVVYTKFQQTLSALTASYPDNVDHFMKLLPELADR